MYFGKLEEEYFCVEGWTGVIGLKFLGTISVLAQLKFSDPRAEARIELLKAK